MRTALNCLYARYFGLQLQRKLVKSGVNLTNLATLQNQMPQLFLSRRLDPVPRPRHNWKLMSIEPFALTAPQLNTDTVNDRGLNYERLDAHS